MLSVMQLKIIAMYFYDLSDSFKNIKIKIHCNFIITMKYQTVIVVVLLISLGGFSTSWIHKLSELFDQAQHHYQECYNIVLQAEGECFYKTAEEWEVTAEQLDYSKLGTKLFCCASWEWIDCMLAAGKVI